ncbi:MAG: hypothetical protein LBB51_06410 [Zoogloeaceae bacterium]|nr:hypothetical protein [Zoogloeaceae bacterium]
MTPTQNDNGTVLVPFADVPEALTFGMAAQDAQRKVCRPPRLPATPARPMHAPL